MSNKKKRLPLPGRFTAAVVGGAAVFADSAFVGAIVGLGEATSRLLPEAVKKAAREEARAAFIEVRARIEEAKNKKEETEEDK